MEDYGKLDSDYCPIWAGSNVIIIHQFAVGMDAVYTYDIGDPLGIGLLKGGQHQEVPILTLTSEP